MTRTQTLLTVLALTLTASGSMQAQIHRTTVYTPVYNPPAPRPAPRVNSTPEPRRIETRPESRLESRPEVRNNAPQTMQPQYPAGNGSQNQGRSSLGANHANATVAQPAVMTPALKRATLYNSRPSRPRISPDYFAANYGPKNGFHFNGSSPSCPTCGMAQVNGESYFNWNGGNFGILGQTPANWALGSDYLYIDIGDDGNYYLYDAQYPDIAVQLTFVHEPGADQLDDGQN
jgi:hypothetical protein